MRSLKSIALIIGILILSSLNAQMQDYQYLRKINGIEDQWHKLELDANVISKLSNKLNDLRIYGITSEGDTIEAAYLLKSTSDKVEKHELNFQLINRSSRAGKFYYTLENKDAESINLIDLGFANENFNYSVKLEGSNDQKEWFKIVEDQTIVSIKNTLSDYQYGKLNFPNSKYQFYRIEIPSDKDPKLEYARTYRNEKKEGIIKAYKPEWFSLLNKKGQNTELVFDLELAQQIYMISLEVRDTFDFYRPIEISYLVDSFETEKGWKYNYHKTFKGTLSSLENADFEFSGQKAQRFKLRIFDGPNPPLTVSNVVAYSYSYYLLIRFTEKADYYLTYGNELSDNVNYEIAQFEDQIPVKLKYLTLEEEQLLSQTSEEKSPLFENELWLWLILGMSILVIGWFSYRMITST